MNSDVLTRHPNQLLRFHVDHQAAGTLCVRYITTVPFGVVQTKGMSLLTLRSPATASL